MSGGLRYLGGRILAAAIAVLGALLLMFLLTQLVPGDPASTLLGPRASPETVEAFRVRMGLDRPVLVQFANFLGYVLRGDLGTDIVSGRPIRTMVLEALPYTVTLALSAMGLALLLGIPLGCYGATHPESLGDRILAVLSVGVVAVPNFVVAILLLLIFAVGLDLLPVLGTGDEGGFGDRLARLVLPASALALGWVGYIARLLRASLVEVLGEAYIRTGRARGIPEWIVVYKHALRNAILPTLAVVGLGIGHLLGGAVFIEIVFARPGIGHLIFDAIGTRNYPVVEGCVLAVVLLFVLANLAVDLLFLWLDPRLRGEAAK
ncbi:MAG: ABC transporter permease [Acidobacteriota bacterium]